MKFSPHGPGLDTEMGTWGSYTMLLRKENEGWRIVAFRPAADARAIFGGHDQRDEGDALSWNGASGTNRARAEVRGLEPAYARRAQADAAKVATIAEFKDHRIRVIRAAEI